MLPVINPANTAAWKKLQEHYKEIKQVSLQELFENDPKRFIDAEGLQMLQ